jgi:hypothetical protein
MEQSEILSIGYSLSFTELGLRLLIDLISVMLIVRAIYYPLHRQKDYMFTFFLFNVVIFMTCLLLSSARIKLGFAFGLFAIFSIMRYRTVVIPIKEMGYFFVCVSTGILNALVSNEDNYLLPILANIIVLSLVYILDRYITLSHEVQQEVLYERIDLIVPEKRRAMLQDLKDRTGLPVHRVEIISIDFLHDTAIVHAFYYLPKG